MYAIIDIETTGGSHKSDKITEIAIFLHDGQQVVDKFVSLVNPEVYIPPFICKLTGITNDMVAKAPKFYEIAQKVIQITENAVFVAHNVQFDYAYVKAEFKRLGYEFKRPKLCTITYTKKIFPHLTAYGLDNLCKTLEIANLNRHRAEGDAKATVTLFEMLLKQDTNNYLHQLLDNYAQYKNLPPNLNIIQLDELPDETGVYYFYNQKGTVTYIGKSNEIKRRVLQHFQNATPNSRKWDMFSGVADVSYEETGSELIALLLESSEIKTLKPIYNKAQRIMKYLYGVYLDHSNDGYETLEVKKINKRNGKPLIEYPSLEEGIKDIRLRIEKFNLCPKLCNDDQSATDSCFHYRLGICKGACIKNEDAEVYNKRVQKAIQYSDFPATNFLIIGEGRNPHEKSVICIENLKFIGYGFFQPEFVQNIAFIKENLKLPPNLPDANKIIINYLKKNRLDKIVKY